LIYKKARKTQLPRLYNNKHLFTINLLKKIAILSILNGIFYKIDQISQPEKTQT